MLISTQRLFLADVSPSLPPEGLLLPPHAESSPTRRRTRVRRRADRASASVIRSARLIGQDADPLPHISHIRLLLFLIHREAKGKAGPGADRTFTPQMPTQPVDQLFSHRQTVAI